VALGWVCGETLGYYNLDSENSTLVRGVNCKYALKADDLPGPIISA